MTGCTSVLNHTESVRDRVSRKYGPPFATLALVQNTGGAYNPNHQPLYVRHRRLQSCVGTRARLGYSAFDEQLGKRILSLHCTL